MKRFFVIVLVVPVLCMLCGCTAYTLNSMKKHAAKQDFVWIAEKKVSCSPIDDGCNQIHLIKGDACFRLAKSNLEPLKNYTCSITELETGMKQTTEWKGDGFDFNRAQTFENLCESIRNMQDLKSGAEAEELTKKLDGTSRAFLAAEPGNPAAVYFKNSAQYTMLRRCLLHPENCPGLCEKLNALNGDLEKTMVTALQTKYKDNFHRLHADIEGAKKVVPGCR